MTHESKDRPDGSDSSADERKPVPLTIANIQGAKEAIKDYDGFLRFHLQIQKDFIALVADQLNLGTTIYEKLILLDGGVIALSITFLGSLSARWNAANVQRPHLWMVAVAWSLLIVSAYCCYSIIVRRNAAVHLLHAKLSSALNEYSYQKIDAIIGILQSMFSGELQVGSEFVDVKKAFEPISATLKKEKEERLKSINNTIASLSTVKHEKVYAFIAVDSTVLAVVLMCVFTIISLRLLF